LSVGYVVYDIESMYLANNFYRPEMNVMLFFANYSSRLLVNVENTAKKPSQLTEMNPFPILVSNPQYDNSIDQIDNINLPNSIASSRRLRLSHPLVLVAGDE